MPAYAVAHLREVSLNPAIVEYLQRIDATLEPFGGRFLVHGAQPQVVEGTFPGHLILIGFADMAKAKAWYYSPAYQAILPLRSDNSVGDVILVEGTDDGHRAIDILTAAG